MALYDINGKTIATGGTGGASPLAGKVLITEGDSITSGEHGELDSNNVRKNYGWYAADELGMTFVNRGMSGTCMSVNSRTSNAFAAENGRYTTIPSNTDYLTIAFGVNDQWATETYKSDGTTKTAGAITDTENTSFYGAMNICLPYLIANHPDMKIALIITNGVGTEFAQAIWDMGFKYGIPVFDTNELNYPALVGKSYVHLTEKNTNGVALDSTIKSQRQSETSYDGTHPNDTGYKRWGHVLVQWLLTI